MEVIFLNLSQYHENAKRGTTDFPVEYYPINQQHPRYNMQAHWHKDIEIIQVNCGRLNIQLNYSPMELTEGNSLFIPGGIIHGAEPENCNYECVVFSPNVLYSTQKIRTTIKSKLTAPVKFCNNPDAAKLFENFRQSEEGHEFDTISRLYAIAAKAYSNQTDIAVNIEYKIEKIKAAITYIEENFSGSITLADLSKKCAMSANYFCRFFKDVTAQTPIEYITTYRLEAACEMLLSGLSVTETAYNCGFNDMSYFIHVFKKHFGVSPKQYTIKQTK